ncbi:MAG: phage integrase SAM-like domain-containing protein, partial [Bacteroidota bacterium]
PQHQADPLIDAERQKIAGISASSSATMIKLNLKQAEKDFKTPDKAIAQKAKSVQGQNQSMMQYANKVVKPTLKGFTTRKGFIESLEAALSIIGRPDIQLAEINTRLLNKVIAQCNLAGHSPHTTHNYWKALKKVVKQATKDEYFAKEFDPFRWVVDKPAVPLRSYKAVNPKVVLDIFDLVTVPGTALWHAQRAMMVSWYGRGIPFCDLAAMKVSTVMDGRFKYRRKKTGASLDLKVLDEIEQIVQDYAAGKQADDYLFPFGMELPEAPKGNLPVETREKIEREHLTVFYRYQSRRRRLNERFRKLAKIAGHKVKSFHPMSSVTRLRPTCGTKGSPPRSLVNYWGIPMGAACLCTWIRATRTYWINAMQKPWAKHRMKSGLALPRPIPWPRDQ